MNIPIFLVENMYLVIVSVIAVFIFISLFTKHKKLKKELHFLKLEILNSRAKSHIMKDIKRLEKNLGALEVLFEENLLPKKFYNKSKEKFEGALDFLKGKK